MNVGVRYDESSLNMNGVADVDGDTFYIGEIEGLDSPEVEVEVSDWFADGGTLAKARYSKRELLIKGNGYAPANLAYGSLRIRNKVESMFSESMWSTSRWIYVDLPSPGISVQMKAVRGGKLALPKPKANVQPFEIPLTCPDPRKYSQVNPPGVSGDSLV